MVTNQQLSTTRLPRERSMFTGELCFGTHVSLAEIPVLVDAAGPGGMAPPASTRICARMKCVQLPYRFHP